MNVHTIHPNLGMDKMVDFRLQNSKHYTEQIRFINGLDWTILLMYSAHKAAGGITSVYRQIGIGCERLVRAIFMDYLGLNADDVTWSYKVTGTNGKERTLSLDGRIIIDKIPDEEIKKRCTAWMMQVADNLELATPIREAITGIVFEVRQGYKSKDSKRQNADIANAANAYANGYIPCLMVMSAQIDDDIVARYNVAKWAILQGFVETSPYVSTFSFFKQVVGFDFVEFMNSNKEYFKGKIQHVLEQLMRAE